MLISDDAMTPGHFERIKTTQNCPYCDKPLEVIVTRGYSCANKQCREHLCLYDGKYVTRETWFGEYIMPMLGETATENVEETDEPTNNTQ